MSAAVVRIDEAAKALTERWLDLAGERLAYEVASGKVCDRCARKALLTIGVAGGIPPASLARDCLAAYSRVLGEVSNRVAELLQLDCGAA